MIDNPSTVVLTEEAIQAAKDAMSAIDNWEQVKFPINLDPLTPSVPIPAHLGITSATMANKHIIMWDFDDKSLDSVVKAVTTHYAFDSLPPAYIVQSNSDGKHFHVYIFHEVDGPQLGHKAADAKHNAHSKDAGFRTLRITPKDGYTPKLVQILKGSETAPEVPLSQLTQFAIYPEFNPNGPYAKYNTSGRLIVSTYSMMQGIKFLQTIEIAQKTKEVPNA